MAKAVKQGISIRTFLVLAAVVIIASGLGKAALTKYRHELVLSVTYDKFEGKGENTVVNVTVTVGGLPNFNGPVKSPWSRAIKALPGSVVVLRATPEDIRDPKEAMNNLRVLECMIVDSNGNKLDDRGMDIENYVECIATA